MLQLGKEEAPIHTAPTAPWPVVLLELMRLILQVTQHTGSFGVQDVITTTHFPLHRMGVPVSEGST